MTPTAPHQGSISSYLEGVPSYLGFQSYGCSARLAYCAVTSHYCITKTSYIQYLLACPKSQWSMPCYMVNCDLTWSGIFRRHLARRVTEVTRLRLHTVVILSVYNLSLCNIFVCDDVFWSLQPPIVEWTECVAWCKHVWMTLYITFVTSLITRSGSAS